MKFVLLNGPPGSGKDTIGGMLAAWRMRFAQPIVDYMLRTFHIRVDQLTQEQKIEPRADLHGCTVREVMINYSEDHCKKLFGKDIFGRWACRAIEERISALPVRPEFFCFVDSGFRDEAEFLADTYGHDKVLQIRLHRPGHDFTGDSRSHWGINTVHAVDFNNDFDSLRDLREGVRTGLVPVLDKWLSF